MEHSPEKAIVNKTNNPLKLFASTPPSWLRKFKSVLQEIRSYIQFGIQISLSKEIITNFSLQHDVQVYFLKILRSYLVSFVSEFKAYKDFHIV